MIVFGTKNNSLRERLLRECEETHKHGREIVRSQSTTDIDKNFKKKLNKSSPNTRNQNTRDFIKKR